MTAPGAAVHLDATSCTLRDWRPEDLGTYRDWLQPEHSWHETNGPYLGRPAAEDIDRLVARAADLATGRTLAADPRASLVVAGHDDRLLGTVIWYWECEQTDWRRLGVALFDPSARGRGVGRAALRVWTQYLFDRTDALRLDLATYSGNVAMCRAAQAAGYTLEARLRSARRWPGGVHDALVYAVLRDEWPRSTA